MTNFSNELQFAIDNNIEVTYTDLGNGETLATWNNGMCNEVIVTPAKELTLTLNGRECEGMDITARYEELNGLKVGDFVQSSKNVKELIDIIKFKLNGEEVTWFITKYKNGKEEPVSLKTAMKYKVVK